MNWKTPLLGALLLACVAPGLGRAQTAPPACVPNTSGTCVPVQPVAIVAGGGTASSPSVVQNAGSPGTDYSANKPSLPNVGANFAASGPYASYVLIATRAANPTRSNIEIANTSGAQIVVVRDDGTAASAAAPANASIFAIAGGSGSGSQGGGWNSTTFKGRVQIYAPASSAQVAVMED